MERALLNEVFDQESAVQSVIETLSKADFIEKERAVRALFTFIGVPNSGKHFLAQKLVEHDARLESIRTFHMDWYAESDNGSASALLEQDLFEYLPKHPRSLLLFEDIEKAELQVQLTLYALLSDRANSNLDLSECVVIFTTSRASDSLFQNDFKALMAEDSLAAHSFLMERLAKEQMVLAGVVEQAFDAKLLSLMNQNSIIAFNKLKLSSLIKIGARALHQMSQNFLHQSDIAVEYRSFDQISSLLTLSLAPYLNAKHIKEKLPEVMFTHIYQALKLQEASETVICSVSPKASEFLTKALDDEVKLLKQLRDQRERVSLEWSYEKRDEGIICQISGAKFSKQSLAVSQDEAFRASDITFKDVAGHKKAKKELMEVAALLKEPKRMEAFGMALPKGMLLKGVAHIGKKMLARAFAAELDMPYIALSGIQLFDENRIAKVYAEARNIAPAIVILDDIDIQGIMGGVVSPLPVAPFTAQLDALPKSLEPGVFTIATTSDVSAALEPLIASGYLDITIEVPKLDMEARRFFIKEILKMPHAKNIDVEKVVRYISGMDGKELKKIASDAALYTARKGKKEITEAILLEQINVIKYGSKLENRQIRDIEKSMETTAYHEAGHAVLSYYLMPEVKIEQVTVAPRSETLGFVSYNNEEYVDASSKEELFNNICVLLAGRMVTLEKYGQEGIETGAVNDLEIASMQIYAAIAIFGMDEELANISVSGVEVGYNKELFKEQIEKRMLIWLEDAKKATQKAVKKYWKAIDAVARALIEKEVIDGDELKKVIMATEK